MTMKRARRARTQRRRRARQSPWSAPCRCRFRSARPPSLMPPPPHTHTRAYTQTHTRSQTRSQHTYIHTHLHTHQVRALSITVTTITVEKLPPGVSLFLSEPFEDGAPSPSRSPPSPSRGREDQTDHAAAAAMVGALHVEMSVPYIAFAPPPAVPVPARASPLPPAALSLDEPADTGGRRATVDFSLPEKDSDGDGGGESRRGSAAAPSLALASRAQSKGLSWRQKQELQGQLNEDRLPDDPYVMHTPLPPPGPEIFMAEATENLGGRYAFGLPGSATSQRAVCSHRGTPTPPPPFSWGQVRLWPAWTPPPQAPSRHANPPHRTAASPAARAGRSLSPTQSTSSCRPGSGTTPTPATTLPRPGACACWPAWKCVTHRCSHSHPGAPTLLVAQVRAPLPRLDGPVFTHFQAPQTPLLPQTEFRRFAPTGPDIPPPAARAKHPPPAPT